jgi:predicted Fe-Mo cluster-binding NifX family protein
LNSVVISFQVKDWVNPILLEWYAGIPIALSQLEVLILRVAVPIWEGRVSPVLDVAEYLLVADVEKGQEIDRSVERLDTLLPPQRAHRFSELGIDILICGAISHSLSNLLQAAGIEVIPCIIGNVEDVLNSYLSEGIPTPNFFMPGYAGPTEQQKHVSRIDYLKRSSTKEPGEA